MTPEDYLQILKNLDYPWAKEAAEAWEKDRERLASAEGALRFYAPDYGADFDNDGGITAREHFSKYENPECSGKTPDELFLKGLGK